MDRRSFIAFGGNLGPVLTGFHRALADMVGAGVRPLRVSSAYRTQALLPEGAKHAAPDYWNAVCMAETSLEPEALLDVLLMLEAKQGRVRLHRWAPRTLDLDLLTYDDRVIRTPRLTVPHPEIGRRLFVLRPLAELAPNLRIPPHGTSVSGLLRAHPNPAAGIREVRGDWLSGWSDRRSAGAAPQLRPRPPAQAAARAEATYRSRYTP